MIRFICIVCCFFFHAVSTGQLLISGRTMDTSGNKLVSLTVSLVDKNGLVLSYAVSDELGYYKLTYTSFKQTDSLIVCINAIGFFADSIPIKNNHQIINFRLVPEQFTLQEVTVRGDQFRIRSRGDTIRYNVDSFSHPQDRVILDVIKKLPGIEVGESGEIKFQGKPINRLYIDGDNLMDGKYNAITSSLPNDMVASVEILQNHQPIKSLRDIDLSDAAALNIVLKGKARLKLIGEGDAALGIPSLYDFAANAMLLNKKRKLLNMVKLTNFGKDLRSDIISHFNPEADLRQIIPLLNNEITNPPLSVYRYLVHEAILADINALFKTRKETELKFNGSFLSDRQQNNRYTNQIFLFPSDTIRYTERLFTFAQEIIFRPKLSLTVNKKEYYLNNVLEADLQTQTAGTSVISGVNGNIKEDFNSRKGSVSNMMQIVKVVSQKQILELYSFALFSKVPQSNYISPGLYISDLNSNQPYKALIQSVAQHSFVTRNYISVKIPGKIAQSYKLGTEWQKQQLQSDLQKQMPDEMLLTIADTFTNQLHWNSIRHFTEAKFNNISNRIQYQLVLPFEYNSIHFSDSTFDHQTSGYFFQPSFQVKMRVTKESTLQLQSSFKNTLGKIYNVYEGYILNSYRAFNSQGGVLPSNQTLSHILSYELNQVPKFLFLAASAGFSSSRRNSIAEYEVSAFSTRFRNILLTNTVRNYNIGFRVSKYIIALRTTVTALSSLSFTDFNQFQNGYFINYINKTTGLGLQISSRVNSVISFNYDGSIYSFVNRPVDPKLFKVTASQSYSQRQMFNFSWFPISSFYVTAIAEYYGSSLAGNNKNDFLFLDLQLNVKPKKIKTDIQFSIYNLLNKTAYSIINTSSNGLNESSFEIRPRNAFIKISYRL